MFFVLAFSKLSKNKFYKRVFWKEVKMNKELILLESEYLENGEQFEDILQNAIEIFLKNHVTSPRQSLEDIVKYK